MIKTFSNKAVEALWREQKQKGLPSHCVRKISRLLTILDQSSDLNDLGAFVASYRIHRLKKKPYENFLSFDITGNYRIIGKLEDGHFHDIDFQDTH